MPHREMGTTMRKGIGMITPEKDQALRVSVLLTQYEVVASHHLGFYTLIWQIPAVAITIGGGLTTIVFSASMPVVVRILLLAIGATFLAAMTIALERFRMFQMRRRKDLEILETTLDEVGGQRLRWGGGEIVDQIRRGELSSRGMPLYRFEGFLVLRGMMYLVTAMLFGLALVSVAALYGWGPLG